MTTSPRTPREPRAAIALSTQAPTVCASFRHGMTTEISRSSSVNPVGLSALEIRVRLMQPPVMLLSSRAEGESYLEHTRKVRIRTGEKPVGVQLVDLAQSF